MKYAVGETSQLCALCVGEDLGEQSHRATEPREGQGYCATVLYRDLVAM